MELLIVLAIPLLGAAVLALVGQRGFAPWINLAFSAPPSSLPAC
jgi:hypothetical protein